MSVLQLDINYVHTKELLYSQPSDVWQV